MTRGIALLMVSSAACALGHLLLGPSLYLRLTLMRTFRSPSLGFSRCDDTRRQSEQDRLIRGQRLWKSRGCWVMLGAWRVDGWMMLLSMAPISGNMKNKELN